MPDSLPNRADRAFALLGAQRPDLAESEFRAALAETPDDARALAGLSLTLAALDRDRDALAPAEAAVAREPGDSLSHAALAQARLGVKRPKEALASAQHAVALAPHDPWCRGLEAVAQLQLGRPKEALAAAEAGLGLDPDQATCLNVRGLALARLNRRDDAEAGIRGALARDPESPLTHTTLGHTLLLQGKVEEAAVHFREALRRQPGLEPARDGLLETLRGRFRVYRWFLAWMSFCARMPQGVLIIALLAAFMLPRFLSQLASSAPWLALVILPLQLGILAFALLTWIGRPLFNALLLFTVDGRLLLRTAEKAWAVITLLLVFAAGAAIAAAFLSPADVDRYARGGLVAFLLLMPVGACSEHWDQPKARLVTLAALLILAGLGAAVIAGAPLGLFTFACLGFVIAANVYAVSKARRT